MSGLWQSPLPDPAGAWHTASAQLGGWGPPLGCSCPRKEGRWGRAAGRGSGADEAGFSGACPPPRGLWESSLLPQLGGWARNLWSLELLAPLRGCQEVGG